MNYRSLPVRRRLDSTIRALCPHIAERIKTRPAHSWCEYDLRKELVGCIMGSQVRYGMAIAATENLERAGLLNDDWWSTDQNDDFGSIVFDVLSGQRYDLPHRGRYRFFKVRTSQLIRTRDALARLPIAVRLATNLAPRCVRQSLVRDVPGLGPKQASMFLRNIGISYDLAILDIHVLRFMDMQDILSMGQVRIGTLAGYEKVERMIVSYADILGYPVGYLDWAIWATMRAARELGL